MLRIDFVINLIVNVKILLLGMDKDVKENIESLRSDLQNLKDEILEKSGESINDAKERIMEKRKKMQEYVQANPEKSVLIALGVGVLIGMMIAMGRRR